MTGHAELGGYDSIDQRLADEIGGGTAFSTVSLGVPDNQGTFFGRAESMSVSNGLPQTAQTSPATVINDVFGGFSPPGDTPVETGPAA